MSSTTFAKGVQFGGKNDFSVRHGGAIRFSLPVEATTVFKEGNALEVNSDGELQLSTAQTDRLTGITNTRRDPVGDQENDMTIGSGKADIILDPAVVETPELTSGAVFAVNSKVFQDGAGHWTDTVGTDTRVYGVALNAAVANASDSLTMLFEAQKPA